MSESQENRMAALVTEFVPLDRRRVGGSPPLSVLEVQRHGELRDLLAWQLGHNPPLGASERPLRVPTRLKARYGELGEGGGVVANLSEGGLFVATQALPAVGTRMPLQIDPGAGAEMIGLDVEMVWGRELANLDGPAGFGAAFRDLEAEEFGAIARLICASLEALARG